MTLFSRILPTVTAPISRKAALTIAGLAVTGGAIAGPLSTGAQAAPVERAQTATVTAAAQNNPHKGKELNIRYEAQSTYYYCGPAATRNALTAQGHDLSQQDLAKQMGTTVAGTDSAEDTTRALNKVTGGDTYRTTTIGASASNADTDTLKNNVKTAVDADRAVVTNVAGSVTDTDGTRHSFPGGHYVSVTGYSDDGSRMKIADSANPNQASYWVEADDMADWIATRGYSH